MAWIGFQRGGRWIGKSGKGGCERMEYRWGLEMGRFWSEEWGVRLDGKMG